MIGDKVERRRAGGGKQKNTLEDILKLKEELKDEMAEVTAQRSGLPVAGVAAPLLPLEEESGDVRRKGPDLLLHKLRDSKFDRADRRQRIVVVRNPLPGSQVIAPGPEGLLRARSIPARGDVFGHYTYSQL